MWRVRRASPPKPTPLLVEQRDLAVVAVVAAHLAVGRVQAGRVGEGRRKRVVVVAGVTGRGQQGLRIGLG